MSVCLSFCLFVFCFCDCVINSSFMYYRRPALMGLPFWQPVDCWVQFDIDFVMKCWLIKHLSIYLSITSNDVGWRIGSFPGFGENRRAESVTVDHDVVDPVENEISNIQWAADRCRSTVSFTAASAAAAVVEKSGFAVHPLTRALPLDPDGGSVPMSSRACLFIILSSWFLRL